MPSYNLSPSWKLSYGTDPVPSESKDTERRPSRDRTRTQLSIIDFRKLPIGCAHALAKKHWGYVTYDKEKEQFTVHVVGDGRMSPEDLYVSNYGTIEHNLHMLAC